MIKRLVVILVLLLLMFSLTACGWNKTEVDTDGNDGRLIKIYGDGYVYIYVDNETGCQYLTRYEGGTCLIVDKNGKPLIYEKAGADND